MTPPYYEIVDCRAFCEVIFLYILPKNLLEDFFDSLGSSQQSGPNQLWTDGRNRQSRCGWREALFLNPPIQTVPKFSRHCRIGIPGS